MKSVPISELKACLSEYLAAVRKGREIVVTDRGKPVAKMARVEGAAREDERRSRLSRLGILSLRRKRLENLTPPPGDQSLGVLSALLQEREGR